MIIRFGVLTYWWLRNESSPGWQESIHIAMESLFFLLESNEFLKCRVTDKNGHVVKRVIMKVSLLKK